MAIVPLMDVIGPYLKAPTPASPPSSPSIASSGPPAPSLASPTPEPAPKPKPTPQPIEPPSITPIQGAQLGFKGLDTLGTISKFFSKPSLANAAGGLGSLAKIGGAAAGFAGNKSLAQGLTLGGATADIVKSALQPGALSTIGGGLGLASGVVGAVPGIAKIAGADLPAWTDPAFGIGSNLLSLGNVIATQTVQAVPGAAAAGVAPAGGSIAMLAGPAAIIGIAFAIKSIGDMTKQAKIKHAATQAQRDLQGLAQHGAITRLGPNLQTYAQSGDKAALAGLKEAYNAIQYVRGHWLGYLAGGVSGTPGAFKGVDQRLVDVQKQILAEMAKRPEDFKGFAMERVQTLPKGTQDSIDWATTTPWRVLTQGDFGRGPRDWGLNEPAFGAFPSPFANEPPAGATPQRNFVPGQANWTSSTWMVPDPDAIQTQVMVGPGQFQTRWISKATGQPYPHTTPTNPTTGQPLVAVQ